MGEHKFVVGMRVGIKKSFPEDNIRRDDVLRLLEKDGDNFKTMVERTGESIAVWIGFLEPLPADPPSVGVPGQGTVVQSVLMRPVGLGPASVAHDYAQQQMAAQQQGQRYGLVTIDEHAALKAELAATKTGAEMVIRNNEDSSRRLAMQRNDAIGERDVLRAKVADLETQVAYLTRELVLARGKMKGAR